MLSIHLLTKTFTKFIKFSNNVFLFSFENFYSLFENFILLNDLLEFELEFEGLLLQALVLDTILLELFHLILYPSLQHILVLG